MSWRVKGIQMTGKCHEENLPMGQDRICYTSKNGIAVIGVADGCSESKASDIGGKLLIEGIANYLTEYFEELYMAKYEKAAKNVADKIRIWLSGLSGIMEADALDYASTLCMIAVDQERYVSLNLGDGCIGAWNQDKAKIISRPLNSFGRYTAYLTVDENIEGCIKIGRGDASKWDGFVILSDGMKDKFRTERKFLRMMNRLTEDANFQMKRLGCEEKEEGNRRDDFSIIVMERANLANCGIYMESFV